MYKKSQITIFIILGIIILVGALIVVVTRQVPEFEEAVEEQIEMPLEPEALHTYVEACITSVSEPLINLTAYQGGTINLNEFRWYNNDQYRYFCRQSVSHGCVNRLITRESIEQELEQAIAPELQACIDKSFPTFKGLGYTVNNGEFDVDVQIAVDDVIVKVGYPITLTKGESAFERSDFSSNLKIQLGRLFDLAINITNNELVQGRFNQDEWMLNHGAEIQIYKHKPYPDTVYFLEKYNHITEKTLVFLFAIQGENTAQFVDFRSRPKQFYGWCKTEDQNCLANVQEKDCRGVGTFSLSKPSECTGLAAYSDEACEDGECDDCGVSKHGTSWCLYDGPAGKGFDYIGSRHYKASCFDGKVYVEDCRDYREELCTQDSVTPPTKAVCRINRWQDCAEQTTEQACLDSEKRDCFWSDWLGGEIDGHKSYGLQRKGRRCHPEVPPGFRFWEGKGVKVCAVANEQRRCDDFSCPDIWTDKSAQYCYFQGDCGNYRTIADRITQEGFHTTQESEKSIEGPRPYIYLRGGLTIENYVLTLRQDVFDPIITDGNEYDNPGHTFQDILDGAIAFTKEASGWTCYDFCATLFGKCIPPCVFDETIFASFMCLPSQPVIGSDDCGLCGKYSVDKHSVKPCTEYRCKSLGQNCIYSEEKGVGKCTAEGFGDNEGPVITWDGITHGDLTIQPAAPFVYTDAHGETRTAEGYFLCNGNCSDDFAGEDGLEPFSAITFGVDLSEDAQCKATFLPNFNYTHEWGSGSSFSNHFDFEAKVIPLEEIEEKIEELAELETLLQASYLDLLDTRFRKSKEEVLKTIQTFKEYIKEADAKSEEVEATYRQWKLMEAVLKKITGEFEDVIPQLIRELESNRNIVFFICRDGAGNQNQNEFFIQYAIGPDRDPPVIVKTDPENKAAVGETPLDITVSLNEPAECRYDFTDLDYGEMAEEMKCPTSILGIRGGGFETMYTVTTGTYDCTAEIPFAGQEMTIYVKCKDQPLVPKLFVLNLTTGNEFSAPGYAEFIPPDTVNITDSDILSDPTTQIQMNVSDIDIAIKFFRDLECRYSTQPTASWEDPGLAPMDCSGKKICKASSLSPMPYYLVCTDKAQRQRNVNEESYVLKYFI